VAHDIVAPTEARYTPVWVPGDPCRRLNLEAAAITTVIWATGFVRDDRWIEVPVFDDRGHPKHWRGVTGSPGLYFLGQTWQSTWGSGRFEGVGRDARFLAEQIDASRRHPDVCSTLTGARAIWRPAPAALDKPWVAVPNSAMASTAPSLNPTTE
jgi:putative flavoprotein involved in K+ transport